MPVITPPQAGEQEDDVKNWYHSENLRKVELELLNYQAQISKHEVCMMIKKARAWLTEARHALDPRLKTIVPNEPPKKRRR